MKQHYIFSELFGTGLWKGQNLDSLTINHLFNIRSMLQFSKQSAEEREDFETATKIRDKLIEVTNLIDVAEPCIIEKHELRISHDDIVKLAKDKGMRVPKSGAGVYCNGKQIVEVIVKFDITKPLKPRKK